MRWVWTEQALSETWLCQMKLLVGYWEGLHWVNADSRHCFKALKYGSPNANWPSNRQPVSCIDSVLYCKHIDLWWSLTTLVCLNFCRRAIFHLHNYDEVACLCHFAISPLCPVINRAFLIVIYIYSKPLAIGLPVVNSTTTVYQTNKKTKRVCQAILQKIYSNYWYVKCLWQIHDWGGQFYVKSTHTL